MVTVASGVARGRRGGEEWRIGPIDLSTNLVGGVKKTAAAGSHASAFMIAAAPRSHHFHFTPDNQLHPYIADSYKDPSSLMLLNI